MALQNFHIVLVGDFDVGKTSIFERFDRNAFNGVHMVTDQQSVKDFPDFNCRITLCDTAGEERAAPVSSNFFRNASGAIVVYDVSTPSTSDSIEKYLHALEKSAPPNIPVVIVGNKLDLGNNCDQETIEALEHKAKHMLCSCRSGEGIEELFQFIAKEAHDASLRDSNKIEAAPIAAPAPTPATTAPTPATPVPGGKHPKGHKCTLL
ncbi:GTP-binding protein ypt5 [Pelomyxa schiedti]|nr:GTP-binding protein ypt5 [Pelomyxa schiedti]